MPNSYTAIPITIDNTQTSATPAPFQQMITVDMNTYSSLANSTLSNVFFLDNNGNPITSWLESGNSNTSTSTVYWLLLPLGIPANSSITVYMCFDNTSNNDFDGITRGEAPQLSSTYAEYDNGTNVFTNYWNFAGTTLPTGWTASGVSYTVNDGISVGATTESTKGTLLTTNTIFNAPEILDIYGTQNYDTTSYQAMGALYITSSVNSGTFFYTSQSSSIATQQTPPSGSGSVTGGIGTAPLTAIYTIQATSTTSNYFINYGSEATLSTTAPTYPLQVGIVTAITAQDSITWIRTRAYPPNGTMPTTTFGTQTTKNMVSPTTSPSGALYYVPITLSNSQSSATGTNFQSLFQINPSFFGSAYLQSTMQNVAFYDTNGNLIDSWQETNNSNTATNSTFWVKLANGISAGTSITIFMYFFSTSSNVLNTTTTGQAPQLTSTYGEYDDGASVFIQYGGASWSSFTFVGGTWTTANGYLQQTATTGSYAGGPAALIESTSYPATGQYVLGMAFNYTTEADARVGIIAVATPTTTPDTFGYRFIGQQSSNSAGFISFLNDSILWVVNNTYQGVISTDYTMVITNAGGIWSGNFYSGYGTETSIPLTSLTPTSYTANNNEGTNTGYVGISAAYIGSTLVANPINIMWFYMRAYPPNGILPVYSYGLIVQTTITTSGSGSASAVATFLTSQAIQSTGLGSATASFILSQATSGQGSGSALASFILSQALNGKGLASTTVSLIASGLASTPEGLAKTSFFILAVSPLSGKTNASGDYNTVVSAAASLNNPTYPTSETLNYSATYLPPNTNVSSVSSSLNSSATITFTYSNTSSYTSPTLTTTIKDSTGTAIPNVLITWTSSNTSAATVSPQTATTNSSGVATTTVTGTGATITATTELLGLIQTSSVSV